MEGEDSQRCRKRKEYGENDEGWYLEKIRAISDDEDDDYDVEKFQISEEAVVEMMRWLEHEIGLGSSSSPSPSHQETTFVTINGNEESCGPSFSGPASTVMASIDTRGVAGLSCVAGGPDGRAPMFCSWHVSSVEDGSQQPALAGAIAADEEEEEWLARVLDGPLLFELEEGLL